MQINDILIEWSYRLKKGYPTMEDGKFTDPGELEVLRQILKENGINEMPSFVKSKTPVSDVVVEAEEEEQIPEDEQITVKDVEAALHAIKPETLSQNALRKLFGKLQSFSSFKPLRKALLAKGFNVDAKGGFDMPKLIANQVQQMLGDLPKASYEKFIKYIQLPENEQESFPVAPKWYKIDQILPKSIGKDLETALASYTGQDEKKRGVGMGELLLSLAFANIDSAVGKGDLRLGAKMDDTGKKSGGVEFEIKGAGAILGSVGTAKDPEQILKSNNLIPKKKGWTEEFPNQYNLTEYLASVAKDGEGAENVKNAVTELLESSGLDSATVATAVGLLNDWTGASAGDINRIFGLANFLRYHKKEGFGAFAAMDYGTKGSNAGDFYLAIGDGPKMAQQMMAAKVGFQPAKLGSESLWPRVDASGGATDGYLKEAEEELDY